MPKTNITSKETIRQMLKLRLYVLMQGPSSITYDHLLLLTDLVYSSAKFTE